MAPNKACNTIPPVTTVDYKTKGTWENLAGLPVYVSGSSKPTTALMIIYDIFGAVPQTLQGADLLAAALEPLGTVVIVPDFFKGKSAQAEWYKPDASEEAKAAKDEFMSSAFEFEKWGKIVGTILADGGKKWDGVKAWASLGLCWGGKVVAVTSGKETPWTVSGQVHPGRLQKEDAEKITIPHIVLASNGEDATVVQEYKDILQAGNGVVETYPTMHHGWMGARANFENEDNLKEYSRGYNQCALFFSEHLKN